MPNIKHVNFKVTQWKLAEQHIIDISTPLEHGWVAGEPFLEPLGCYGAILPTQLIDILESKQSDEIQEITKTLTYTSQRLKLCPQMKTLMMNMDYKQIVKCDFKAVLMHQKETNVAIITYLVMFSE